MARVQLVIPAPAMAAHKAALAHIVANELDRLATEHEPAMDVEYYEQSEEDERNGVRTMCNVLRTRAAELRSTTQEAPCPD